MRRFLLVLLLAIVLPASAAQADPFTVINTKDSGDGSLRAAIEGTNNLSGGDVIAISASGKVELDTALPTITGDVAITGPGAGSLTVGRDAATEFRIFDFASGITASLTGLTITGGADPQGAGIRNGNGDLTLTRVVVEGNEARVEGGAGATVEGGGILSNGPLTVRESTISDNAAVAHGEGGKHSKAIGGGIAGGSVIVERSTVSGNSVVADTSLTNEARGGGLQGVALNLTSSTVTGNSLVSIGAATGANIEFADATLISNTIIANAIGDDESCSTPEGSGGFNLDEDGSCGLAQPTDRSGLDAGLDPALRDNGGPTPTHALLAGSAAIDRGNSFGSSVDQRGLPRPSDFPTISNTEGGDGSDIGAFELQAPPAASGGPVLVTEVPADRQPPDTRIVKGPARDSYAHEAKFRFVSTEAQSRFQCKVDLKPWRGCRNPYKRWVGPGKHVFKVRAIDRYGNVDQTPARFGWRVKLLS
jgi:hypothetical protein